MNIIKTKVQPMTKQFAANWTTLPDANAVRIEELSANAAKEIADEIYWALICYLLKKVGWHCVVLPTLKSNMVAVDIHDWLPSNCCGNYKARGRTFIFENEKDANWFTLRWM